MSALSMTHSSHGAQNPSIQRSACASSGLAFLKGMGIVRCCGYLPDLQNAAVQTVLLQVETLCRDWAA